MGCMPVAAPAPNSSAQARSPSVLQLEAQPGDRGTGADRALHFQLLADGQAVPERIGDRDDNLLTADQFWNGLTVGQKLEVKGTVGTGTAVTGLRFELED